MKKLSILLAAVAMTASAATAFAEAQPSGANKFKFYGFVRNYFAFDTRESTAGTGDLYYWIPKDRNLNTEGVDMNLQPQFRFLAITSRVGVDASGYYIGKAALGAKIEADFYAGLTGSTGTAQLRLRQAFFTVKWDRLGDEQKNWISIKAGQAWHPMAADLPDIFSLESGAPFNAFSRTPQVTFDFGLGSNWSVTYSALWQMQYCSMGPDGASSNYIKYGVMPEQYFGINYKKNGFLGRIGMDLLSIKPRDVADSKNVKDRITTISPYLYAQYTKDKFKLKFKTIYSSAGEHMNLMSGYAICDKSDALKWKYTPIHTSSSWLTLTYGKKWQGALLLGYIKNLGTSEDIIAKGSFGDAAAVYFQKNGGCGINQMTRIQPEVTYNVGKLTLGLEYMLTGVQYGDKNKLSLRALPTEDLHWIFNNRFQAIAKFTF